MAAAPGAYDEIAKQAAAVINNTVSAGFDFGKVKSNNQLGTLTNINNNAAGIVNGYQQLAAQGASAAAITTQSWNQSLYNRSPINQALSGEKYKYFAIAGAAAVLLFAIIYLKK